MNGKGTLKVSDLGTARRGSGNAEGSAAAPTTTSPAPARTREVYVPSLPATDGGTRDAASRNEDSQIEFQDIMNSMGRYKWHGAIAAILLMIGGYFLFAANDEPTYATEATIMRRESGMPIYWLLTQDRKPTNNRTYDGDIEYLRSRAVAEIASRIGRGIVDLSQTSQLEGQRATRAQELITMIRNSGADEESAELVRMVVESNRRRVLELQDFGLIASLPDGTGNVDGFADWTVTTLTADIDRPSGYLPETITLRNDPQQDDPATITPRERIRMMVRWSDETGASGGTGAPTFADIHGSDQAAIDNAIANLRTRIPGLRVIEFAEVGPLGTVVGNRAAGSINRSATGSSVEPDTLLIGYRADAHTGYVALLRTQGCTFLIEHRVDTLDPAFVQPRMERFLQLLGNLQIDAPDYTSVATDRNGAGANAGSMLGMSSASQEFAMIGADGTIEASDRLPRESAGLFVGYARLRDLLSIWSDGSVPGNSMVSTTPTATPAPATEDVAATGDETAGEESPQPATPASPLTITDSDRAVIAELMNNPDALSGMISVSGEAESGRISVRVNHPRRHVSAFVGNLMLTAFIAANTNESMASQRRDLNDRQQAYGDDLSQVRDRNIRLDRLRSRANERLLSRSRFDSPLDGGLDHSRLKQSLVEATRTQENLRIEIEGEIGAIKSGAERVAQLSVPSTDALLRAITLESERLDLPTYNAATDDVIVLADQEIAEVRRQMRTGPAVDERMDSPLMQRLSRRLQVLVAERTALDARRRLEVEVARLRVANSAAVDAALQQRINAVVASSSPSSSAANSPNDQQRLQAVLDAIEQDRVAIEAVLTDVKARVAAAVQAVEQQAIDNYEAKRQAALDARSQALQDTVGRVQTQVLGNIDALAQVIAAKTRLETVTQADLDEVTAALRQVESDLEGLDDAMASAMTAGELATAGTDANAAIAMLANQDLRDRIADMRKKVNDWLNATKERTDRFLQSEAYAAEYSPVASLEGEIEQLERRLQASLADLNSARINATRLPDDYEWIRSADPARAGTQSQNLLLIGIALVSILGGLFIARVWDLVDTRIKTDLQVKEITRLPILGHLPVMPPNERYIKLNKNGSIAGRQVAANLFGILGVNLRHAAGGRPPLTFCVTSSVPREGKSLVAYDLASYYALEGYKTCLLIADVRNPSTEVFKQARDENTVGFLDHLADPANVPLRDCIFQTDLRTMHVVFPGNASQAHPIRAFDEDRFPALLDGLRERFEVIIIDAPPVVPVVDGTLISKHVDGTLLVVRVGTAYKRDVAMTMERLSFVNAPLVGVVVNADPTHRQRAYYYYYNRRIDAPSIQEPLAIDGPSESRTVQATGKADTASLNAEDVRAVRAVTAAAAPPSGGQPAVPYTGPGGAAVPTATGFDPTSGGSGTYGSTTGPSGSYSAASGSGAFGSTNGSGTYGSTNGSGSYGSTNGSGTQASTNGSGAYGSTNGSGSYGSTNGSGTHGAGNGSGTYADAAPANVSGSGAYADATDASGTIDAAPDDLFADDDVDVEPEPIDPNSFDPTEFEFEGDNDDDDPSDESRG